MNQIIIKQLKNRYGPLDRYRKFSVGVDKSKMRVYNVEQAAQEDLIGATSDPAEIIDLKSKFKTINFN